MDRRYSIHLTDQGFRVSSSIAGIEACGSTIEDAFEELERAIIARSEAPIVMPTRKTRKTRKGR